MSDDRFDVAIVGGGLAGCSAAIALARSGFRVIVIEAAHAPHDKVCGEFLSPESALLLRELGAWERIQRHQPPRIDRVRITAADGVRWDAPLPGAGFGLSRGAFDADLLDQARAVDVIVRTSTTVTDVRGSLDAGFTVETRSSGVASRVRARVVIGAHGKRSTVDRTLDRDFLRAPGAFVGLKAHFRGPSTGSRVELHAFDGGYCGLSAIEERRVNLCLLVRQSVYQRFGDTEAFVAWMAAQNPALDTWLASAQQMTPWYAIAQVSFAPKPSVDHDVIMAGDSAGLIAPLAGDGMSMALQAGLLAAGWAGDFLAGRVSAEALRRGYDGAWRREFGQRLSVGRALQAVMLRPHLLSTGLRVAALAPALGSFFVARTRSTRLASG